MMTTESIFHSKLWPQPGASLNSVSTAVPLLHTPSLAGCPFHSFKCDWCGLFDKQMKTLTAMCVCMLCFPVYHFTVSILDYSARAAHLVIRENQHLSIYVCINIDSSLYSAHPLSSLLSPVVSEIRAGNTLFVSFSPEFLNKSHLTKRERKR